MSKAPSQQNDPSAHDLSRAIQLLKEALGIVDRLGHPDIGARLQDVIDRLSQQQDGNAS
jgi:hypothetical protein